MGLTDFPEWSDLGDLISRDVQDAWEARLASLTRYDYYFSGDVFEEYLDKEHPSDPDVPLFPAGINLIKTISTTIADTMFGEERDELPFRFEPRRSGDENAGDEKAIELGHNILIDSNAGTAFWEMEMDRQIYGAGIIRVGIDLPSSTHIRWKRVRPETFMPVWDPEDENKLLEVYVATYMSFAQAKALFGYTGENERILYLEHWTQRIIETWLDGKPLKKEANLWGVVPFVYIPRIRTKNWWGNSITEDLIPIQDEFNMRLGDIGEIVSTNAHPIVWGLNLTREFVRKNFPRGSDKMWDLGRTQSGNDPKIGILETQNAILQYAFQDLELLLQLCREAAGTPAIAFGSDDGGGQRSSDTLVVRLRPMVMSIARSRRYMTAGIKSLLSITSKISEQKSFRDIPITAAQRLARLVPSYNPVLPKSQPALVDEVVRLLSTDPPSISLETAQVVLGRGSGEADRIRKMLKDEELWSRGEKNETGLPNGRTLPLPGRESKVPGTPDNI